MDKQGGWFRGVAWPKLAYAPANSNARNVSRVSALDSSGTRLESICCVAVTRENVGMPEFRKICSARRADWKICEMVVGGI